MTVDELMAKVYYDSTDHKLKVYYGTSWTNLN